MKKPAAGARKKTVLERRAPPTFDVLIEIQERNRLAVHEDVAASVDAMLRGNPLQPEIRYRDENDEIHIEKPQPRTIANQSSAQGLRRSFPNGFASSLEKEYERKQTMQTEQNTQANFSSPKKLSLKPLSIYPYGVARNRMIQSIKKIGVPATIIRDLRQADVLVTLKSYYRNHQKPIAIAEEMGIPIYVLRSNSSKQIEQAFIELFNLNESLGRHVNLDDINVQTMEAIESVRNGQRWVDLPPASARVRRIQHELVREAELVSHSYGKEPNRHVRIFRE